MWDTGLWQSSLLKQMSKERIDKIIPHPNAADGYLSF